MAKTIVVQPDEKDRSPFLRGILVHSLQNSGLRFSDAHALANTVRDQISDRVEIESVTLKSMVVAELERAGFEETLAAYTGKPSQFSIEVVGIDGELSEFSRQEYWERLKAIGLRSDESSLIVGHLQSNLLRRRSQVSADTIDSIVYRMLRRSKKFGPAVAHRWLVWCDFVNSGRPIVLLIGGTAGSGKSTIAADLASGLGITRSQSTDILREVIRSMGREEDLRLLQQSSYTAWQELPVTIKEQFSEHDELVMEGFRHQADAMASAVDAVIQRAQHESVSLIMEGVHIRPAHAERYIAGEGAFIFPLVLGVVKRKRLQQRLKGRSDKVPQRRAERYLSHLEEIWALQSGILSEADQHGVPIILNDNKEITYREIMLSVIDKLSQEFSKSADEIFVASGRQQPNVTQV